MNTESSQNSAANELALSALVRLAPPPWTFDAFKHRLPKYRSATIYAADSTRICVTTGEHAEALAELIVNSVNQCLQNDHEQQPERSAQDA